MHTKEYCFIDFFLTKLLFQAVLYFLGCMWSICGIHDQGWAERAVFGKIRYMNYQGCKRKFDVVQFERRYASKKRKGSFEELCEKSKRKKKEN